ncbi:spore germination protein [Fictibacillus sp. 7GRE50]|nr:spore germination protein [Fictibacillus sp. 7GRE50]
MRICGKLRKTNEVAVMRFFKKVQIKTQLEEEPLIINKDLTVTLNQIKSIYKIPLNSDVTVREFHVGIKKIHCCLVYIRTIIDQAKLEENIIGPLLQIKDQELNVADIIYASSLHTVNSMNEIVASIRNGNAVLLIN